MGIAWLDKLLTDEGKKKAGEAALEQAVKSGPDYSNAIPQAVPGTSLQGLMAQGKGMEKAGTLDSVIAANGQAGPSIMPNVDLGKIAVNPNTQSRPMAASTPTQEGTNKNALGSLGDVVRSEGRMGTDNAEKGFGNDLYKFIQSIGYGMIDKPLGREANTFDYLGKTIGQIARVGEGSGLSAGQPIYTQERNISPAQNKVLQTQLANAPQVIATIMADPSLMKKFGVKNEKEIKQLLLSRMVAPLGIYGMKYTNGIKAALGMDTGMESFASQLAGATN